MNIGRYEVKGFFDFHPKDDIPRHSVSTTLILILADARPGSRVVSGLAFHSGEREIETWPGWRSFESPVTVGSQTPVEFQSCYSEGT